MVQRFATAGRWGIYFRVVREGLLEAGDALEQIHSDPTGLAVYEVARVFLTDRDDRGVIERLASHERLDPSWRSHFAERLRDPDFGRVQR